MVGTKPQGGSKIKLDGSSVFHISQGKLGTNGCKSCCTVFYTADQEGHKGEIVGIGSHKDSDSYNMEYAKKGLVDGKVLVLK